MKKTAAFTSLALALTASMSCEQQEWKDTKMFNQNRHAHGAEHGTGHDAHGAKPDAHAPAGDAHAPAAGGHAPAPAAQ